MKKEKISRYILLIPLLMMVGLSIAITLKASVGVGPWDGFLQTISNITNIKIGYVLLLFSLLFIIAQYLLLKEKFEKIQFFQFALSIILGFTINFALDHILIFELKEYLLKLLALVLGTTFVAFFMGGVLALGVLKFPLEGMCIAISERFKKEFVKVRFITDFILIVLTLILIVIFRQTLVLREGSIINFLMFSPILDLSIKLHKKIYTKANILK